MATFAYGRVSTKEQETKNQRVEIERAGYTVDYWPADEGVSRKSAAAQRPEFATLPGQIRSEETLVVSKLNRLGRDALDVGATIKALAARKIHVVFLQLGKLELTSAAGKLMLAKLAAVAEMERDLLVERTQAGLAKAKQQGKTLGRATKTTAAQRADIIERHRASASISELSRAYGISRVSITRIAKPEATSA